MKTIQLHMVWTVLMALLAGGCTKFPAPVYTDSGEMGAVTAALDDHDYDLAAESIAQELMTRGLPEGYVVALGPVETRDCKYDVQIQTLQKSLQVIFNKEGTLKFTAAVDAMTNGESADQEIYKTIEYNYFVGNPMDSEQLKKFGSMARVNGILFGRVSCIERKIKRMGLEVSYRFVWELADTETGLLLLSHEKKIRKNVR